MSACIRDPGTGSQAASNGLWFRLSALLWKLSERRKQATLEATLAALEDYQLDDVGIMRSEISAYAKASPRALQLMTAMLDRIEVASERVPPGSLACSELLRECRICPNVAACEKWLLTTHSTQGYRAFCPNATLLDQLPRRSVLTPA